MCVTCVCVFIVDVRLELLQAKNNFYSLFVYLKRKKERERETHTIVCLLEIIQKIGGEEDELSE